MFLLPLINFLSTSERTRHYVGVILPALGSALFITRQPGAGNSRSVHQPNDTPAFQTAADS
jgi:hypothetical protein